MVCFSNASYFLNDFFLMQCWCWRNSGETHESYSKFWMFKYWNLNFHFFGMYFSFNGKTRKVCGKGWTSLLWIFSLTNLASTYIQKKKKNNSSPLATNRIPQNFLVKLLNILEFSSLNPHTIKWISINA